MKMPLALLVFLSLNPIALAQSDEQGKVIAELKAQLALLKAENTELKQTIVEQEAKQAKSQNKLAEMQQELQKEHAHIQKLARLESDLQAEFSARDQAMEEHAAALQNQLSHVKEEEEALRRLAGSLESARTMADRLAAAKIENRMSMLQSQAMLQALESFRKKSESQDKAIAELATERAKLLVKQRHTEYDMLRELSQRTKDDDARTKYRAQLELAMLGVREAELLSQEAKLTAAKAAKGMDERIAEAALNLAVSEQMDAFLKKEMSELQMMLRSSAQLDELAARRDALQAELIEIETASRRQRQDFTEEKVRLEMELNTLHTRLDHLTAKRGELTQQLGEKHPVVANIDDQISALKEHLEKLKK